jgi:cell division protein DivIC
MERTLPDKNKFLKGLKNKYFIASLLFLVWIVFFDENSFISHAENKRRLHELNNHKEYYLKKIKEDKQKMEELHAGKNELEKFAREQFYMSKPDEDLFIVVEE